MTVYCTLHPSRPAHFQCNACSSTFCGKCIVRRAVPEDFGSTVTYYICPFCDIEADQLEVGNLLDPFWTRMPKFFTYPVQTHPLMIALALSVLAVFFSASKLVGLFSFIMSTKYAYAILTNTAQGDLKAPQADFEMFNSDVSQVFKQYAIFVVLFFFGSLVFSYTGPIGGIPFALAAVILLPAMLMLLVSTNSIIVALNPMFVVPIVFRIGWRYLLMFLFLILLPAGPAALLYILPKTIPWGITVFTTTFLQHYYTFISYNLMGYVLLQYHKEIGYGVDYEHFISCSTPEDELGPQDPVLARRHQIDVLIKSGRHEMALKLINEDFPEHKDDIALSGKYLDLLRVCRKKKAYAQHGPVYLQQLIRKKKATKALKVYRELTADGTIPVPIESSLAVGKWMFDRNEYRKAGNCYLRCIKENQKHPKLPEAYFPFIQLLHEHFGKTEKAVQLSKGVIRTWPDHPLTSEVKTYLNNML
jgi:hypothetical protein